jgi:hypothetical protein
MHSIHTSTLLIDSEKRGEREREREREKEILDGPNTT